MLQPKLLALFILSGLCLAPVASAADKAGVVSAHGTGMVEVEPDIARLGFGVSATHPTVAEGRDEVARGVARLIALARDMGLKDEHIATAALHVRPHHEWNPETRTQRLAGYVVTRQVALKLSDLSRLGELTEQALGLGVTEASPAAFDTSRRAELEAEALAAAARDARARARVMAEALDMKLGVPLHVETGGVAEPPQPMLRAMALEADGVSGAETYQPGLIRVSAAVTARFALER
jgi:uncharacterized protein